MFKHLLVPVDGSATSDQAIAQALAIAQAFASSVSLIYVVDPYAFAAGGIGGDFFYGQTEYLDAATTQGGEAIAAAKQIFDAHGINAVGSVVEGQPIYRAILDSAESVNADLVVMGSHGRRGLEKLVLGSVTAQVLAHAHLSVLVVRE